MAQLPGKLPSYVHCSLYAEHIYIWASSSSTFVPQQQLEECLDVVDTFFTERGVDLSPSKSAALPFTQKHLKSYCLSVRGHPIEMVRAHRFLGIYLDRFLT